MEIISPTEKDEELMVQAEFKRQKFLTDMVKYKEIFSQNFENDYPFFLYLASILNFVEYHNEGCLTELGMKSLELDISPYINKIQEETKLEQKELVRFLLNLVNSYATTFLSIGLFELAKEAPDNFFELNKFPLYIQDDFELLLDKSKLVCPKLKQILDTYCPLIELKYKKIFLQEKTKGFIKQIYDANDLKLGSNNMPPNIANAHCMN